MALLLSMFITLLEFCDMHMFLSGTNLHRFFYRLFTFVLRLDPINLFNPATVVSLSQARTWISNAICRSIFVFIEVG